MLIFQGVYIFTSPPPLQQEVVIKMETLEAAPQAALNEKTVSS